MRKLSFALAALAVLASVLSCSKYETVKNDPLKAKIYTLDNGLKVYMSVNKNEPRIQTYMAVKVGGKNDPSETTGLAHYFEHLMFKGTEQFGTSDYQAEKPLLDQIESLFETYRKTEDEAERAAIYHQIDSVSYEASKIAIPNEYDKLMAMIGANGTNAWTSEDETVYTEDIPSNQIDNWARIQADRFKNCVIRGFHTELETIYEEKNMSLTQDFRKIWEALYQGLFPHHPYGTQTVLGTQEHLKNPSITNVKKYHDTFYVPNNIAICVSGDFKPSEMVAAIEKYFGDWKPNPSIPSLKYENEAPITEPVVKDVYGLESEVLALGWPLPGASDLKETAVAEVASSILFNGSAGLIDLNLSQKQMVLGAEASAEIQPDYSAFIVLGMPKEGQSLDEVRDLLLSQVALLRDGQFSDELISATVNNIRLNQMRQMEHNSSRAHAFVDAFIRGIDWKDAASSLDRYASVTKEDIVAWAEKYLKANGYVAVNKHRGEDTSVQKISAPSITPIETNRNAQSAFLAEIQNTKVEPIEPVFVDFSKEMSVSGLAEGIEVLYKKNEINDIFQLTIIFNRGTIDDPALSLAANYLSYLGTDGMSQEEMSSKMYSLACDWQLSCDAGRSWINITGLSENMPEALKLVEDLMINAVPDEEILANLKSDVIKQRDDAKKNQRSCFSALQRYMINGPEFIRKTTLSNEQIRNFSSEELLSKVRGLLTLGQRIKYYGPESLKTLDAELKANHIINEDLVELEEHHAGLQRTEGNKVLMAQYDAAQIYYLQYSNRGEKFDPANNPGITIYNEYFGSGMNGIVFQEMREARGLAYSAWARLTPPYYLDEPYNFVAFIATQNDKMRQAMEAFSSIINDMPESEAAFSIAKEGLLSRLRTQRTTGMSVLNSYEACERLGLDKPMTEDLFNAIKGMTIEDVKAAQQKWAKGRDYTYAILGDIKDLDTSYLATIGPIQIASLEEIFGY